MRLAAAILLWAVAAHGDDLARVERRSPGSPLGMPLGDATVHLQMAQQSSMPAEMPPDGLNTTEAPASSTTLASSQNRQNEGDYLTNDEIKSLIHRQVASANLSSSDENVERYGKVGAVAADMVKDAGHSAVAMQAAGKAAAAAISRGATHSSAASAAEAADEAAEAALNEGKGETAALEAGAKRRRVVSCSFQQCRERGGC